MVAEEDSAELRSPGGRAMLERITQLINSVVGAEEPGAALTPEEVLALIDLGGSQGGPSGRHWVLDPIDGTRGFVGMRQYSVCLGMLQEGEVSGCRPSVALLSAVILGLFFGLERYTELSEDAVEQVDRFYMYFIHVQIMVFVGFGFLMTFMRRYSHSAVALNYLASALVMLEAVLVIGATQQGFWNQKRSKIQIDIPLLIDASFCAASGMIAFGAIIGKSTPTQTLWLLVFQIQVWGRGEVKKTITKCEARCKLDAS
ncbi:SAL1 phosphatase, partial [Tetrabaena socialis]